MLYLTQQEINDSGFKITYPRRKCQVENNSEYEGTLQGILRYSTKSI